jgi:hypothetical protein
VARQPLAQQPPHPAVVLGLGSFAHHRISFSIPFLEFFPPGYL